MRDLGDVIASLSDDRPDAHLYSTLAPLYDFVYERHFDYDEQLAVVTGTVPEDAEAVLEVGCGTGRLLVLLETVYETAVGVERSDQMARRARARTDAAEVVVGDATRVCFDRRFDAAVALGRVTGHLTDEGAARRFAENCFDALGPGGVLVFDYFPTERMEDDHRKTDTFESDEYRVERRTHTTIPDPESGHVRTEFEYDLRDRETGASATAAETMTLRTFGEREVHDLLEDAGFAEVEVRDEAADGWPLAVARRAERNH